jgi:hypothetical protein
MLKYITTNYQNEDLLNLNSVVDKYIHIDDST